MLLVVIVCPHQVQDGLHPPLAEGALGLALSTPQEAFIAEVGGAWQHVAGLLAAAQAWGSDHLSRQ